jgi:hypothetical protein
MYLAGLVKLNTSMNTDQLIAQGNQARAEHRPGLAVQYYTEAFVSDPGSASAFNNYGNVLREMGYPDLAIPYLERSIKIEPNNITAEFNLAICYLLMGDYSRGWPQYEKRWQYEHLAGTLPKFEQPRWTGQDLRDKTVLVIGEQGHGDNIQFVRFLADLQSAGAKIKLQVTEPVVSLMRDSICEWYGRYDQDPGDFDYWVPIMSIPGVLGSTLANMPVLQNYLSAEPVLMQAWQQRLGPKKRMRVGFAWSGRRDNWVNVHKGMPLENMLELIRNNPQFEWISLQADATSEDDARLDELGVTRFPGAVSNFADTAALMMHLDVVLSVDTAVAHLAGSLGRPTWIMLCQFAVDWRWLLERDSSPWYPTARLFRQPAMGDWTSVTRKVSQYLSWFKV